MFIGATLPYQLAIAGIHGVDIAQIVPEIQARLRICVGRLPGGHYDGSTYFCTGTKDPAYTTAVAIQRIHPAVLTAHMHRASAQHGVRTGAYGTGKTKGPLDLQVVHIAAVYARHSSGKLPAIVMTHTPAGDLWRLGWIERCRTTFTPQKMITCRHSQ